MARDIESIVSREHLENLVARTTTEIASVARGKRAAFAWSGGKDSLALQGVCEAAGIKECVLGMTHLEYPAMLRWLTDHMPDGLTVINTGQDLKWLSENPQMLFPQDAATAAKWFRIVQHTAQERYFKSKQLDVILLGRRRADGNFVGRDGANIYESRGVLRYSPLADWSHEEVIAFNHYYGMPTPPCYSWPNGFVVGTGSWPARQYTGSVERGWAEVFSIDPAVVEAAASLIPSARSFLFERAATMNP
jgi:3'-phosphoadenosine 5'-phosphosulfate sulfotransferase (PAPS reductase)/FAD synthetase